MATGGVTLTEDDLSCEICFDLYSDPKTLKCLHTFCGRCISQLGGNRRTVECPNCREKTNMADVRKDFRIQKLLDKHLGQVGGTSAPAGDACGMCKKKGQSIQMYCTDCDKLLCAMCCRIHADIKDIANHATMSKPELTKKYRSKLQTKLDLLQTQENRVSIKVNYLDYDLSRLQQEQGKLMKTVDKEIDNAMRQLNRTRLELHKKIEDSDKNLIESLKISKAKCMKEKTDICSNIIQIRGVIDKDDLFMLKKRLITEQLSSPLPAVIRINFDKFPSVKVVTGSWRPDHEIVRVVPIDDHEIAGGSAIRNKVPVDDHELPDYSVLKNNKYVQDKIVATETDFRAIQKVKIIDDKLYCACGYDGIEVYDKNCEYITSINSDNFGVVTGVAESGTGELIVSCSLKEIYEPWMGDGECEQFFRYIQGGLHQVTLQGINVTLVTPVKEGYVNDKGATEGQFYDVCVYNGIVYGLTGSEIQQFQLKNSEYVQVGTIDLKTKYSRMCINNEHIFLSSYSSHGGKIFVYNKETQNTQEFTNQSQSNWHPRVCSADHHSNLLVVDRGTNSVYVYNKDESKWHEVLSVGYCLQNHEGINNAVVDESGDNIWVATNKRLIQYTKKSH